jgi:transposase, IS30 family
MGHGDYEKLTPQAIGELWVRLRVGKAAKPTARELGLCTGTVRAYLLRCGGIRPDPRRRAAGRLTWRSGRRSLAAWRRDTPCARSRWC